MTHNKHCTTCKNPLEKNANESVSNFKKRVFCSTHCRRCYQRDKYQSKRLVPETAEEKARTAHDRASLLAWFVSRGRAKPGDDLMEVISRPVAKERWGTP